MTFHKLGPNGNILDNFGLDTGMRIDRSGNIIDRYGLTTFRSLDQFGNIINGRGGIGPMTGLKLGSDGLITSGGLPAALDGVAPLTGTRIGSNSMLVPGIVNSPQLGSQGGMSSLQPGGIPSGTSLQENPDDMSDDDWHRFMQRMKSDLDLYVCKHTRKHKGLFGRKWGCGRKQEPDDRCEEDCSNQREMIDYIADSFSIDADKASSLFRRMKEKGLIGVYKCKAVFFNV